MLTVQNISFKNSIYSSGLKSANKPETLDSQVIQDSFYTALGFYNASFDWSDFYKFISMLRQTGAKSAIDIIDSCTKENIIGSGANSIVYKFSAPDLKDWVIKFDTFEKPNIDKLNNYKIYKVQNEFPKTNMGQEIARIGDSVHILRRLSGKAHSLQNWSYRCSKNIPITADDATDFLSDVRQISQFSQKSFDDYAEKLKILDNMGYKADSFNPNNYLIDYDNQSINIIDAYKYKIDSHLNTRYDLFCPLVDYLNFEAFFDSMNEKQKVEFVNLALTLFDKCTIAAKKFNISLSEDTFREFVSRIDYREDNNSRNLSRFNTLKKILLRYSLK